MITTFPDFTKLELDHKEEVQSITDKFQPYSDFNFTSLFCWNTDGSTEVSILNENLVIKMPDYITGKPIYSILGNEQIDASLSKLFTVTDELRLVPEVVIDNIAKKNHFSIYEDRDNFDYVYSLDRQSDFNGGEFRSKRKRVGKFLRTNYEDLQVDKISFSNADDRVLIKSAFQEWAKDRGRANSEVEHEKRALARLIDSYDELSLTGIKITIENKTVGFSINEIIQRQYAICHFQKAIISYDYLDIFISNLVAKELKHFGCKYVNWEQDLGIPGLRELKMSYCHDFFLKKYTVSKA